MSNAHTRKFPCFQVRLPRSALLGATLLALAACTGTVKEEPVQRTETGDLPATDSGVIFYPPAYFLEVSQTTVVIDKKGQLLATADSADPKTRCVPILSKKLVLKADLNSPRRVYYASGLLENNKFAVEFADGMLKSVNTESQPDRGATLSSLAGTASTLAGIGLFGESFVEEGGPAACNAGAVVVGLERYRLPN